MKLQWFGSIPVFAQGIEVYYTSTHSALFEFNAKTNDILSKDVHTLPGAIYLNQLTVNKFYLLHVRMLINLSAGQSSER